MWLKPESSEFLGQILHKTSIFYGKFYKIPKFDKILAEISQNSIFSCYWANQYKVINFTTVEKHY